MVDNFNEKLFQLLDFPTEDVFYFLQLLQRRKDNPEQEKNMIQFKTYRITSIKQLNKLKDEIVGLCECFNARAYINPNKRSFRRVGLETLKATTEHIINENYKQINRVYCSVCSKHPSDSDKKWIIDIDWGDVNKEEVLNIKENLLFYQKNARKTPILVELPTKNGVHFITRGFNTQIFKEKFPNVEIKKDSPTLLFCK